MKFGVIFLALAAAWAQTAPTKNLVGEITSADVAAKQLKVKGDDGANYTIALEDHTAYLRLPLGEKDIKKAEKISLSDVSTGDRLIARGSLAEGSTTLTARTIVVMSKADIAKKQAQDRADWQRRGIAGTITSIDSGAKAVTINTHGRDAKTIVIDASAAKFLRYAPDSIRFADAKPGSFSELKTGDTLRALGNKSEDGAHYQAEQLISGSFQTIAATVNTVDAASGELQVMDLETKKTVAVRTNQNSMLRRLPEILAVMLARRLRPDGGGPPGANGAGSGAEGRGRGDGGSAEAGRGGFGGAGGRGGFAGGGSGDLQQVLERAPQLSLSELKKGDALIVSSSKSGDGSAIMAITLVAGVEPFLAAAPRSGGQVNLGSWNIEVGVPEQ